MRTSKPWPIRSALLALATAVFASSGIARAGSIVGSLTQTRVLNRNLTLEGTQDWAVWGFTDGGASTSLSPDVHKNGGMGISSLTDITNGSPLRGIGNVLDYGETTFNWSDGTPTASATGAFTGIQHFPGFAGEGFSFTVTADTVERELSLYVTVHHGIGRLTATLSDASASPYTQDYNAININNSPGIYKIDYAANSPGQTLNVQLTLVTVGGSAPNVAIQGASLALVPEPSSLMMCASGSISLITVFAWRCRRNWPTSGRRAA